tara:strand:- start:6689 stop:7528 length:840 start_codon:yes stop_codon:yes gene_type:complete
MVHCWKITRNDGTVQGFTDHDNDLTFDSVTYEAATGFTASQFSASMGLAVDNMEVEGAISSSNINEDDLAAGHYDNAVIEVYWVNWSDVSQRHIISKGFIGEVKRHGVMFSAETRGLTNALQQKIGRKYQRYCQAIVGDARCGIDLTSGTYRGSGTVSSVLNNRSFTATGLAGFADDWFTAGMVNWTSGNNNSSSMEVKLHSNVGGTVTVELWQAMPLDIASSDAFYITVGCKQDAETCNEKFSNIANFRGFNLIPGPDMLLFYPKIGDDNLDGGSLFT